ncbi:MAG: hypothetical protein ACRCZ9_03915 [Fusobacteriaceae bacterium]
MIVRIKDRYVNTDSIVEISIRNTYHMGLRSSIYSVQAEFVSGKDFLIEEFIEKENAAIFLENLVKDIYGKGVKKFLQEDDSK